MLIINTLASSIPQNDDIQNQLKKEIIRIDLVKSEIASMSLATVNKLYLKVYTKYLTEVRFVVKN